MENIYYIHDASDGRLIIREFHEAGDDIEERVEREAEREGMRFKDCEWGFVSSISINV